MLDINREAYTNALASLADGCSAQAAAQAAEVFCAHANPLHAAMRGLGLPAARLTVGAEPLAETNQKFSRLRFVDQGSGADLTADFTANGSAFHGGRRYEAGLSRIDLSDAEIARTGVLRVEYTADDGILITLLTFDGHPAKLRVSRSAPLEPVLDGKPPEAAIALFKNRPESASLAQLAREAAELARGQGADKGFFARLVDGAAAKAKADLALLLAYANGAGPVADEGNAWKNDPQRMREVAAAALRRFDLAANQGEAVIRLLVVVAVGYLLARI